MPRLSTGFVRANGYANKVRKVLFALTRGKVVPENVVRASAHLNQYLFDKLQELSVKKEDVVRISIGFSSELLLPLGRGLLARIGELSNLSEKLKELSEEVSQIVETLKREHTSLKLEFEK